jgi:hypothetical protein
MDGHHTALTNALPEYDSNIMIEKFRESTHVVLRDEQEDVPTYFPRVAAQSRRQAEICDDAKRLAPSVGRHCALKGHHGRAEIKAFLNKQEQVEWEKA